MSRNDYISVSSPFPDHAIPRVWTWIETFRNRVADDFAPQTLEEFVRDWESREQKTWGVYRDEELGGLITVEPVNPVTVISHCLFKKEFWGQKTTIPALRIVYGELFEAGINKIMSMVFADNKAIKSLALRNGAKKEGYLRSHTMRGGKPVDMEVLALLREDF